MGADRSLSLDRQTALSVDIVATQSVSNIGAGQGAMVHDGFVYLYGDADVGIVREFRFDETRPALLPTGRNIRLTKDGREVASHPTGLTVHPDHGAFLGDTVSGEGVIHHIDWDRALKDGDLDKALLNSCADDLAINGCRPEFVRHDNAWYVATADYGARNNHLRLYVPKRLARADLTSEAGVLHESKRCAPFVQTLHWVDGRNVLVLVQNQTPGHGYRLTPTVLWADDLRVFTPQDMAMPTDELEGFEIITTPDSDGWVWGVLLSASRKDNVHLARVKVERFGG